MDTIGKMLIRTDADTTLGIGYAGRCVSLASAWIRMGGGVDFAGNRLPVSLHHTFRAQGCELLENADFGKPFGDLRVINELLRARRPDFLVLDGQRFDQHFRSHLQLSGTRLVVIESGNQQADLAITDLNSVCVSTVERIARRLAVQYFRFRSTSLDDVELLHRWRNDPEARAGSFKNECVSIETHRQWLKIKLASDNSDVRMIEDRNGNAVGCQSLDYDGKSNQAEMNIYIIPSLRGCGLGTAFIELACAEMTARHPDCEVITRIKSGNLISQSAFQKAGFRKVASTTINGQVAKEFSYVHVKRGKQIESGIWNQPTEAGNRRQAS